MSLVCNSTGRKNPIYKVCQWALLNPSAVLTQKISLILFSFPLHSTMPPPMSLVFTSMQPSLMWCSIYVWCCWLKKSATFCLRCRDPTHLRGQEWSFTELSHHPHHSWGMALVLESCISFSLFSIVVRFFCTCLGTHIWYTQGPRLIFGIILHGSPEWSIKAANHNQTQSSVTWLVLLSSFFWGV